MTDLLVLGGERREAIDGATADVIEPRPGVGVGGVAKGSAADAARAVDIAAIAFEEGPWRRMSARERGRILTQGVVPRT